MLPFPQTVASLLDDAAEDNGGADEAVVDVQRGIRKTFAEVHIRHYFLSIRYSCKRTVSLIDYAQAYCLSAGKIASKRSVRS